MITIKHFAMMAATALMALAATACGDNDEPDTGGKTFESRQLASYDNGNNNDISYEFHLNQAETLMDIYTDRA